MTLYKWSQTAANNATADSSINWQEGQAPSSVNDSARAMMASVAKWRDDVNGINVTGGSGTVFTLTSNQVFASNGNGNTVQFTPGTSNTGPVTLSIDGNTARPLRFYTGVELLAGMLISGSLYHATFRSASNEWLLHAIDPSIYSVPLGAGFDYWALVAPNGAFALAQGQQINRTAYAQLFALFGTTYGVGDGSTTFNLPDKVGRVSAMRDGGSARLSTSHFGGNPANLGASGGAEYAALDASLVPTLTSSNGSVSFSASVNSSNWVASSSSDSTPINVAAGSGSGLAVSLSGGLVSKIGSTGSAAGSVSVTSSGTGGAAPRHNNTQPTIICNYIIRVL
jgi:microcystin-dependent protein